MDLLQTVRKEGSRGGRGEFKWDDVKNDAHRENYLGHSVMAPVGRWQKNKDLSWYAKVDANGKQLSEAEARKEEIRKVKEAESDALARALGYDVPPRASNNANMIALGDNKRVQQTQRDSEEDVESERDHAKRRDYTDSAQQTKPVPTDGSNTERSTHRTSQSENTKRYARREDRDRHHRGHKDSLRDSERHSHRERHRCERDDSRERRRRRSRSRSGSRTRHSRNERRHHSKERRSHRGSKDEEHVGRSRYSRSRSPDRDRYVGHRDRRRR